MGLVTRSYDFVNGTIANGDEVDTDLNKLYTELNGNIDDANIKPSAAIAGSKIASGSITIAQLADDSVDNNKLKDDAAIDINRAVTRDHIRDAAINSAKILATAIGFDRLNTSIVSFSSIISPGIPTVDTGVVFATYYPLIWFMTGIDPGNNFFSGQFENNGQPNWIMRFKLETAGTTVNWTAIFLKRVGT